MRWALPTGFLQPGEEPARLTRGRRGILWLMAGVGSATAIAGLDVALGSRVRLVAFLVVAPLIAAVGGRPRGTALATLYTTLLALVLGWENHFFGTKDHLLRVGVIPAGGLIAVWIALARGRELAARRRYRVIAGVGEIAQRSLDPEVMAIEVARLASFELADWCFVFLRGEGDRIRQVAAVHWSPGRQQAAWDLLARYPLDPARDEGPAAVIRDGRPRLYPEVGDDVLRALAADEENLRLLRELRMRSAMVVPIATRGRTLGAIAFATAESGGPLDEADLELGEEIAARMAVALENARLYIQLSAAESRLRASRDELQAILDGVADAVTAQRPDGELVYANDAAVRTLGFSSVDELLATPVSEVTARFEFLDEDGNRVPIEALPGRRALSGERSPEPLLGRFRRRGDPTENWVRVKAEPVFDERGDPVLAINVMEDVTEVHQASEGERFLAEASAILASSLDHRTTLSNVARLAVPRIADWCAVDILEDGKIRHVVVAHSDPGKVELAVDLQRRWPVDISDLTGVANVLRTGEPELYPEIPDELLAEAIEEPERLEIIRSLGMRSVLIVPMAARGRMLGAVTLVNAESGRSFGERDLPLARDLANRCALAVDNARLYGERTHIARTLQESLLPPELPQPPGLEIAARFRAAGEAYEVGGDFYDVFKTAPGEWAAVIGDVCGKGPEAAALTALARYTLRATAMREKSPSRILATLNEAMLHQRTDRRFCTVLYAHIEAGDGEPRLRFASGGHPLPLVLRSGGAVAETGTPGTLLGVVPDPDLSDETLVLRPGDSIVLYTDGLTDAAAPRVMPEPMELAARVHEHDYESADEIAEHLLEDAVGDPSGRQPRDDIAILVVRFRPGGTEEGAARASTVAMGAA
ncbi:MAG: GAF domain-containing protein [Actinobacteria bacterium]|nr:MAG: GAF domain-containing protein [Actinomycetota bacterium]